MKKYIELHAAYMFDCEMCGRENFIRAISPEFSDEEKDELKKEMGIEEDGLADLLLLPEKVICQFCNVEFYTETNQGDFNGQL